MRRWITMIAMLGVLSGCGEKMVYEDVNAFKAAYYQAGSGSVVEKVYGKLAWTCKLVPRELDALENPLAQSKPSAETGGELHFILHVGPSKEGSMGDVMVYGVSNEAEYAGRMMALNFGLREAVRLHVGEQTLEPVLVHMENTYGPTEGREIHLVFADAVLAQPVATLPDLDLVLYDEVFNTGISHFKYPALQLAQLPRLQL